MYGAAHGWYRLYQWGHLFVRISWGKNSSCQNVDVRIFQRHYQLRKPHNIFCKMHLQELWCTMGNSPSKSASGEEPVKTTLFEREPDGITYRIPALVYLRHSHTFLAFAEKRSSPSDCDAKNLVMRRGMLKDDGSVQVVTFCNNKSTFNTSKL